MNLSLNSKPQALKIIIPILILVLQKGWRMNCKTIASGGWMYCREYSKFSYDCCFSETFGSSFASNTLFEGEMMSSGYDEQ